MRSPLGTIIMRQTIIILTFLILLFGCQTEQNNLDNSMERIREDFAKEAEIYNKEIYTWEEKIEEMYGRADKNLQAGIEYADSIMNYDKSLDKLKISELLTLTGEIYYDNDSISLALERFDFNERLTSDTPRNKANKAGCYIKQGELEKAMSLLNEASEINYDFKWYIGNLYEIQGEPKMAILEYEHLYRRDTIVYAYCNQRIQELKANPDQLMTTLYFKDRRKRTFLLLKGVGEN